MLYMRSFLSISTSITCRPEPLYQSLTEYYNHIYICTFKQHTKSNKLNVERTVIWKIICLKRGKFLSDNFNEFFHARNLTISRITEKRHSSPVNVFRVLLYFI